jgi:hypothetical protein
LLLAVALLGGCRNQPKQHSWSSADSARIVQEILAHRAEADSFFRFDPSSPFLRDTTIEYRGIHWFPPDVRFCFTSKLYKYDQAETVVVLGTKGEERRHARYGYFLLNYQGTRHKLNVYKFTPYDAKRYALYKDHLSVWFTDETTGKESYNVGRYVEVGTENPDPEYEYTIDLNRAYNPYCAYSALFSCAIPRKEDRLAFAVHAGEKKYHMDEGEH